MMQLLSAPMVVLLLSSFALSIPLDSSSAEYSTDPDITGPGILAAPTYTTISAASPSEDPFVQSNQVTGLGQPISGTSYFSIASDCYSDTRAIDRSVYKNRGEFFEQAYKDAVAIADQATKWPMYGTDVSDMYFGPEVQKEEYSNDIVGEIILHETFLLEKLSDSWKANLKVAAGWDHPRWGFDNYIVSSSVHDFKNLYVLTFERF